MEKKRLIVGILIVGLLLASLTATTLKAFSSGGGYSHPIPSGLKPGDIVLGHSNGFTDWIIPGFWTHAGMIVGYDSSIGDYIVVESTAEGVHLSTLSEFFSRYDTVAVVRVATTDSIRQAAVQFALAQLGKPYDIFWFTKQVYGWSYYCSELVWASYKAVGGPDIDENPGWSWTYAYGVAPQEVYDDGDTYVIYYDSA